MLHNTCKIPRKDKYVLDFPGKWNVTSATSPGDEAPSMNSNVTPTDASVYILQCH